MSYNVLGRFGGRGAIGRRENPVAQSVGVSLTELYAQFSDPLRAGLLKPSSRPMIEAGGQIVIERALSIGATPLRVVADSSDAEVREVESPDAKQRTVR